MIKLINNIMAKINKRRFVPTPEEAALGHQAMSQAEVVTYLMAYKAQNPKKYAAKKEALFAKYGLDAQDEPEELVDEEAVELEAIAEKVAKEAAKKATKKTK